MRAEPKRTLTGSVKVVPGTGPGMWIECEVTRPPSRRGQSVDLYLDDDAIAQLLPKLRHRAIEARR